MFTRVVFQVKHCSEHSCHQPPDNSRRRGPEHAAPSLASPRRAAPLLAPWGAPGHRYGPGRLAPGVASPRRATTLLASRGALGTAAATGFQGPSGCHHSSVQPRSRQANQMTSQPTSDTGQADAVCLPHGHVTLHTLPLMLTCKYGYIIYDLLTTRYIYIFLN